MTNRSSRQKLMKNLRIPPKSLLNKQIWSPIFETMHFFSQYNKNQFIKSNHVAGLKASLKKKPKKSIGYRSESITTVQST